MSAAAIAQPDIDVIYHADCRDILAELAPASVDMVLCDLPYGTTHAGWDTALPMAELWPLYKRAVKPRGAIVLFARMPFTAMLYMSKPTWYRHYWVWDKTTGIGIRAKYGPIPTHEDILVFSQQPPFYNPIMRPIAPYVHKRGKTKSALFGGDGTWNTPTESVYNERYPTSVIRIPQNRIDHIHPTQKPVELFEYLIKSYSNPGDLVLDNCAGSGTTAVAAMRTGRYFICVEQEARYYHASVERLYREPRPLFN